MPPRNIPRLGKSRVSDEVLSSERQLKETLSAEGDYHDAPIDEIFTILGFKKAAFSDIPESIRLEIIRLVKNAGIQMLKAVPPVRILSMKSPWPENFQVSVSDDSATIYFLL